METWENRITEALADLDKATKYAEEVRAELAQQPDAPLTVAEAMAYRERLDDLSRQADEADSLLHWQQRRLDKLAQDVREAGLPTGIWMVLSPERAFRILYSRGESFHLSIETRPLAFWGDHRAPTEVEADIRDLHQTERDALI